MPFNEELFINLRLVYYTKVYYRAQTIYHERGEVKNNTIKRPPTINHRKKSCRGKRVSVEWRRIDHADWQHRCLLMALDHNAPVRVNICSRKWSRATMFAVTILKTNQLPLIGPHSTARGFLSSTANSSTLVGVKHFGLPLEMQLYCLYLKCSYY